MQERPAPQGAKAGGKGKDVKIVACAITSFNRGRVMDREMEERAISLAVALHAGQKRKDGSPYILHPLRVMTAFNDVPGYEGVILRTSAVLHDVVEDCEVDLPTITLTFGADVSEAVDRLTRRNGEVYSEYVARCADHPLARRVKIADTEDNLRDVHLLPDPDEAKGLRKRYEWTLSVLR